MLYLVIYSVLSIIGICTSLPIAAANGLSFWDVLIDYFSFLTFAGVCCGVLTVYFRIVFKKFNPNNKIFKIPVCEQKFYEKIKLKNWKHIVPDFGNLVGFKKKIDTTQCKNSKFYKRFLYENINASSLHGVDILLSPIFFLFIHSEFYITIGLCGMLIIFILNILPVMIQRYTRTKLLKLYNKTMELESFRAVCVA